MKYNALIGTATKQGERMSKPTVLLVDDNVFHRHGVQMYLEHHDFVTLTAVDAQTAWCLAADQQPDVAIIDIVIPPTPQDCANVRHSVGVDLAIRLKRAYSTMGIVLFSSYEDRGHDVLALALEGVLGIAYQLKGIRADSLLKVVYGVMAGQVIIDRHITGVRQAAAEVLDRLPAAERAWTLHALEKLDLLSPREYETARGVGMGYQQRKIAENLSISAKAVENYIYRIYSKLDFNLMSEEHPYLRKDFILAKALLVHDLNNKA